MRRPFDGDIWLREVGSDEDTFKEIVVKQVYNRLFDQVKGCGYLIDLGANIGLASRLFANTFPGCKIFAVEPDANNFTLLQRNLASLIGSGRCAAERAAVWDRDAKVNLGAPPDGTGFNAIRVSPEGNGDAHFVDGYTMSTLFARSAFPRIDVLKVDVEGAEVELFHGDVSWLERVGMLAIEFHGDSRAQSGFDAMMARYGFKVDDSHAHTVLATRA